jgi:RNA polymerase nonessential primary-like sigma factor
MVYLSALLSVNDFSESVNSEELFLKSQDGDIESRNKLICNNLKLVYKSAYRYIGQGSDLESLFNTGVIGLIKAIEKFDVYSGNRFSTYAMYWIVDEIRLDVLKSKRIVHVPIHVSKAEIKVKMSGRRLEGALCRAPTDREISEDTGINLKSVNRLNTINNIETSIDSSEDEALAEIEDQISEGPTIEKDLDMMIVIDHLEKLPDRTREAIKSYYGLDGISPKNFREIALEWGVTKQYVDKVVKKGIKHIQDMMI